MHEGLKMNSTIKRSKSCVVRPTIPLGHVLNRLWGLNLKSLQKPKLNLNALTTIKSSTKIKNNFSEYQDYGDNQNLIGEEDMPSSSHGVDAVGASPRIPKGSLAVYVGPELHRFVIPACYLSMPDVRELMDGAAEEFGYHHQGGGIRLPNCDQHDFRYILAKCMEMRQTSSKGRHANKTLA